MTSSHNLNIILHKYVCYFHLNTLFFSHGMSCRSMLAIHYSIFVCPLHITKLCNAWTLVYSQRLASLSSCITFVLGENEGSTFKTLHKHLTCVNKHNVAPSLNIVNTHHVRVYMQNVLYLHVQVHVAQVHVE